MVGRGGCREWDTPYYGVVITLICECGVLVFESWDSLSRSFVFPGYPGNVGWQLPSSMLRYIQRGCWNFRVIPK